MEYKKEEIKQYIPDSIENYEGCQADDLHNGLFNNDYYLIGYYNCERWLNDKGLNNTFEVINYIKEYEQINFGEITTNFSNAESVVNMYVWIIGNEILNDIDLYEFEGELTKKDIEQIKFRLTIFNNYVEFSKEFNKIQNKTLNKIRKITDNAINRIKYNLLDDNLKPIVSNKA